MQTTTSNTKLSNQRTKNTKLHLKQHTNHLIPIYHIWMDESSKWWTNLVSGTIGHVSFIKLNFTFFSSLKFLKIHRSVP